MSCSEGSLLEPVSLVATLAFVLVTALGFVGRSLPIVQPVVSVVFVMVIPGALFIKKIGVCPELSARWVVYTVGVSLMIVNAVGFVLLLTLPLLGVSNPLSTEALAVALPVIAFTLCIDGLEAVTGPSGQLFRHRIEEHYQQLRPGDRELFLACLLPLSGVLAITHLNLTNDSASVILLLVVLASIPILAVTGGVRDRFHSVIVWTAGLTILYHKSLWAAFTYGGHESVVNIWKREYWSFTEETLLSNAVLMPSFAKLTGIEILTQMKIILPVIVAFIPLAMLVTFREYTTSCAALLGVFLFMFAHPFYFQYPSTPRASLPVFFLVLLGVTISDTHTPLLQRNILALIFTTGIVVSHYGTAYYVLFAIIIAVVGIALIRNFDRVIARVQQQGSDLFGLENTSQTLRRPDTHILRPLFVLFYGVIVFGWYNYVDYGSKFTTLIEHVIKAYQSLFVTSGGKGATATRLSTDYGGLSIQYSKYIYVLIGFLTAVGFGIVFVKRLVPWLRTRFDDEYLLLSASMFVLFGGTFIISGEWGGGRPMMIVLSFTAVLPVIAVRHIGIWISRVGNKIFATVRNTVQPRTVDGIVAGDGATAILLATFFVLNSGVMAAVAYGGQAPSNVPTTNLSANYNEQDIRTHVWLTDHRETKYRIYGDRVAYQQATDWLNGEIAARSTTEPYRFHPSNDFATLNDTELETGYLLFMSHNVIDRRVEINYIITKPLERYTLLRENRNKLYSNGANFVYFTDNATAAIYSSPTVQQHSQAGPT